MSKCWLSCWDPEKELREGREDKSWPPSYRPETSLGCCETVEKGGKGLASV